MLVASVLSLLLPGAGQLYVGARRRGLLLLGITALGVVGFVVFAAWMSADAFWGVDRKFVATILAVDLAVLAFRVFAVADVWRGGIAGLAVLVALTAAPHVAAGYLTVRSYDVLESVFADEEPAGAGQRDLLLAHTILVPRRVPVDAWELGLVERLGPGEVAPLEQSPQILDQEPAVRSQPWTTILLFGTDEGPGNWGARTDTIILVALQHGGTGRAAAFGIPRNLAQVPLGPEEKPFGEPLNALYGAAGSGDAGAKALKEAASALLGLRVDYYALVNLLGFADLVDALGGVEIDVKERLVDEVTRPAWGERKPRIDVYPGRTYRFYGREALAYVRSRKDSSDYTRMARQRCFLSAMADQLDPVRVLRNFGSLAKTIETNVHTDIPLNRLPSLVRLVSSIEPQRTLTVTFGPDYFFGRRNDRYPVPNLSRMRTTVRSAILQPALLTKTRKATTTRQSC